MPLRLIVVGKTGHGKSSTCNTLVGGQLFKADFCASAVTTSCQAEKNDAMGLTIVDTPGLCDSEASLIERALEIQRSVLEVCKEPHAFLLVFKLGRLSSDDQMTIDLLGIIFGEKVFDHSIVVLTHGCDNCRRNGSTDELSKGCDEYDERNDNQDEDNELASFCSKSRVLEPLVRRCNGRVIRIENNVEKKCSIHTTKQLFSKLIRCVKSVSNNGKTVFTNTFLDAHHQTLENYIEQCDTLQNEIALLRYVLTENLEKAKDEERERKEIQMKVMAAVASTIGGIAVGGVGGIVVGGIGGTVGAGLLVKSAVVGAAIGGPAGAIVGLGIGAAVVGTAYSSKQKKN